MFVLTVTGLVRSNCVRHVTEAILSQDRKARVEVLLSEGLIHVETHSPLEKIKRSIEANGYQVVKSEERP